MARFVSLDGHSHCESPVAGLVDVGGRGDLVLLFDGVVVVVVGLVLVFSGSFGAVRHFGLRCSWLG